MARSPQDKRVVFAKQTEVDFGSTPVSAASFTISDEDVLPDSRIMGSIAYEAPSTKDLDDIELDAINLIFAPGLQSMVIHARGQDGYLEGKYRINYFVG